MSEYESRSPSGWAVGGAMFAGVMMMIVGIFEVIAGISAISKDDMFVKTSNYVFHLSVNGWGWIHLLLGILIGTAGSFLFTGAVWARTVGVIVAVISAIANFAWLPWYPIWESS